MATLTISIPYGSIKREQKLMADPAYRNFNSLWFD